MRPAAVLFASALAFTTYSLYAGAATGIAPEWSLQGEAPQLYSASVDTADTPSGNGSLVLKRTESSHPYGSAFLLKSLPAGQYAGKRIRVSYHILSQGVDGANGGLVVHDSHGQHSEGMTLPENRWTWHNRVLTLPKDVKSLATGIWLKGPGAIKVDEMKIEVLGDTPPDQLARHIKMEKADK